MEHHHEFDDIKEKRGVKYDDKKPRLAEMLLDMREPLLELCKVWEYGASKYTPDNWKRVPDAKTRYTNAMLRHLLAEEESLIDDESKLLHASHIVFNALARLYFILQEQNDVVTWKDNIADFYECNQGIYNLEPCAINEVDDKKVRDIVNNYFTNTIKESKKIDG